MSALDGRVYFERRIYGTVLRLHPAEFRDEFGREMALDFEDAVRERRFTALLGDALLSLVRQWTVCAFSLREAEQQVAGHPFLAGQYCAIDRGPSVSAFDLARASVVSVLLFLMVGFAANTPNRRSVAEQQTMRANHDGGAGSLGEAPARGEAGRKESPGTGGAESASGLGVGRLRGPLRLSRGYQAPGFGRRASGGPPARAITLADALRQLTMISVVIWLTSFFLRRSPGVARKVALGVAGLLGVAASVAFGQSGTQVLQAKGSLPAFEVATVKPNDPKAPFQVTPPGSEQIVHAAGRVRGLVMSAYGVGTLERVVGGPDWVDKNLYRIEGKIPDDLFLQMQKMTADERHSETMLMMQSLLADRFQLKAHVETREMPIYELTIAKGGPKLPPPNAPTTDGASVARQMGGGELVTKTGLRIRNMTLDGMLTAPWFELGTHPIVNKTGLAGKYDLSLNWLPDIPGRSGGPDGVPAAPEGQASIFTALEDGLGLKLVATKAQVEVVVIDSIELPSEN